MRRGEDRQAGVLIVLMIVLQVVVVVIVVVGYLYIWL